MNTAPNRTPTAHLAPLRFPLATLICTCMTGLAIGLFVALFFVEVQANAWSGRHTPPRSAVVAETLGTVTDVPSYVGTVPTAAASAAASAAAASAAASASQVPPGAPSRAPTSKTLDTPPAGAPGRGGPLLVTPRAAGPGTTTDGPQLSAHIRWARPDGQTVETAFLGLPTQAAQGDTVRVFVDRQTGIPTLAEPLAESVRPWWEPITVALLILSGVGLAFSALVFLWREDAHRRSALPAISRH